MVFGVVLYSPVSHAFSVSYIHPRCRIIGSFVCPLDMGGRNHFPSYLGRLLALQVLHCQRQCPLADGRPGRADLDAHNLDFRPGSSNITLGPSFLLLMGFIRPAYPEK